MVRPSTLVPQWMRAWVMGAQNGAGTKTTLRFPTRLGWQMETAETRENYEWWDSDSRVWGSRPPPLGEQLKRKSAAF